MGIADWEFLVDALEAVALELAREIIPVLKEHRSGQLILDIKDGRVVGWRVSDNKRLDKQVKYPIS